MAVGRFRAGAVVGLCLMAMVVVGSIRGAEAHLTPDFYARSCPLLFPIVRLEVVKAILSEARMAASLVRIHFHDCFVNGCDGSILLDEADGIHSEQFSIANNNSIRGLDVIDRIKAKVEKVCPQTVSCADIVAIAYRDAAVTVGLIPGYTVLLGRRDSLTASRSDADKFLPSPFSNYSELVSNFQAVGLNEVDLVTLSGAHTFGRVNCTLVRLFLDDTTSGFDPDFLKRNRKLCCPATLNKVIDLDLTTPNTFDNWYYKNLLKGEGVLKSDQVLWSTPGSINQQLVATFAANPFAFNRQFAASSIKMGNISPLTGNDGEVRLKCGAVNDKEDEAVLKAAQ